MNDYSSVDPRTGTVRYDGPSEVRPGNHSNMPSRTDAYLPTDERGHVQASSLGGSNERGNVVPQSADLNHGAYYSMEQGERAALKDGAVIHSEKIAFSSNPGQRPDAFMVNDQITYADGTTQEIHLSFANLTNAEQEQMNAEAASLPAEYSPNPEDGLRDSLGSPEAYAELMDETDAQLPSISDEYVQADYSGPPVSTEAWDSDFASDTDSSPTGDCNGASADTGCDSDAGADASSD